MSTAVVAYSGGLDTSCIVSWLKEDHYGFDEVVAVYLPLTRLLNLYRLGRPEDGLAVVDLPGYGYAKVSGSTRSQWPKMIEGGMAAERMSCCGP